jgi:type IV secretory pathway VirB2 component (pilin)
MRKKSLAMLGLLFFASLLALQLVLALDFNQTISADDQATFDQILAPVMKVYNLVKYVATAIAVVVLLFAGITYITSGDDPGKREKAKSMAMYVIIGLIVIWAAPLVVNFIVG